MKSREQTSRLICLVAAAGFFIPALLGAGPPYQGTGIKIGSTDSTGTIVWARLTTVERGDPTRAELAAPGAPGEVRVRYWPRGAPEEAEVTAWRPVDAEKDYTRQIPLAGLKPGTDYRVAVEGRGADGDSVSSRVDGQFKTAPDASSVQPVLGVIVTCQGIGSQDSPTGGHKFMKCCC